MKNGKLIPLVVILILIGFIGFQSYYFLENAEEAVVQRFGRVHTVVTKSGLNFKIPLVDKDRIRDSIQALARRFKLDINPDQLISEVNVATRQKVEILKMLYREADILIFDEPTAILTPQEIDYLMDIIRELREGGKTVILISHKLEEIKAVADRCGILNRGRLVDIRTVASTTTREMANLMVGREVILEVHKAPARFGRTVLEVEDLKVTSREKLEVVKGVSFSVRQGEIFAIAGVAGNGQTEIADAITGLVPITSGRVKLLGREITELTVRERNLSGISYIPEDRQSYGLILDYDLSYNLALRNYFKEPFSSTGGRQASSGVSVEATSKRPSLPGKSTRIPPL